MSKATGRKQSEENEEKSGQRSAEELARAVARKRQKRAARASDGRCAYCGKLPQAGESRCGRCLALQWERNRALAARRKAAREAARRAAAPRQCPQCGGSDLAKAGTQGGRPYFRCRTCRRHSYGDGPAEPKPEYRCPYCEGLCRKWKIEERAGGRKVRRFLCLSCGRSNTNLWPEDAPSPGGPFPHKMTFQFNKQAQIGLEAYLQAKGMSAAQAVRALFIAAGQKPLGFVSRSVGRRIGASWDGGGGGDDGWGDDWDEPTVVSVAIPAPALPRIPAGGVALPDLRPEATRKMARQTGRAWHGPTVLVTWRLSVCLNDAALQGLLATMARRELNHQEAARAICAEARV